MKPPFTNCGTIQGKVKAKTATYCMVIPSLYNIQYLGGLSSNPSIEEFTSFRGMGCSSGFPAQNPAFNLPYCHAVRLAGNTLAEAYLEHSK